MPMLRRTLLAACLLAGAIVGCSSSITEIHSVQSSQPTIGRLQVVYSGIARASLGRLQIIKTSTDPTEHGQPREVERHQAELEANRLHAVLARGFNKQFAGMLQKYRVHPADSPTEADYRLVVYIGAAHIDAREKPYVLKLIVAASLYDPDGKSAWSFSARMVPPNTDDERAQEALFATFAESILGRMRRDRVFEKAP